MSRYDDIVAGLIGMLQRVRVIKGFRTDAGARTWLNLEYQTSPPDRPCLILFVDEVSDSLSGDPAPSLGEENHNLPVKIEGFIDDGATGAEGQKLRQDILQAFNADRSLGGLLELVDPEIKSEATVEEAGEGGFISFVQVELNLFYVTLLGVG